MDFTRLQTNKTEENPSKIARCTRIPHPQALTGRARWPAAHQPESRPTRGLDPRRGAARARRGRGPGVARVARYRPMRVHGDGERQRREVA